MGKDKEENVQSGNSQSGGSSSNTGSGLPKPDPDLSDYYKRDGDSPNVEKK